MRFFSLITFMLLSFWSFCQQEIGTYYFVELILDNVRSARFSSQELDSIQRDHLRNIQALATSGNLVLAGPFKDGGGLFILKAESLIEAEELVSRDPAVAARRFTFRIREWYTEKGLFSLESN